MTQKLEDIIGQLFSQMSYEERLAYVDNLRRSRLAPKETSKKVIKAKQARAKVIDKVQELFDSLSPEERAKFLCTK